MNRRNFIARAFGALASLALAPKLIGSVFDAVGPEEEFSDCGRMIWHIQSSPACPDYGYAIIHISLKERNGVFQWRSGDTAMSPEFTSKQEASLFRGPMIPQ